ncbi:hypothetical protein I4U23_018669 [Adineta vaga]|nr:hypothetical protein I4U23_018669 [Adineta vaga]
MTHPRKELAIACSYLLRLIKPHVELSPDQINVFKRTFHDVLLKRFIGHWFPATPHRGSAYRCLQTKHWKDPVLKSIAERSRLPLHRYLPVMFTMWIDPGEVAVCFGDEGTWCPLYKNDNDGDLHQAYSDGEESGSCMVSDDELTQNMKTLNIDNTHVLSTNNYSNGISMNTNTQVETMNNCNHLKSETNDWNIQQNHFWSQQQLTMIDGLLQGENF